MDASHGFIAHNVQGCLSCNVRQTCCMSVVFSCTEVRATSQLRSSRGRKTNSIICNYLCVTTAVHASNERAAGCPGVVQLMVRSVAFPAAPCCQCDLVSTPFASARFVLATQYVGSLSAGSTRQAAFAKFLTLDSLHKKDNGSTTVELFQTNFFYRKVMH